MNKYLINGLLIAGGVALAYYIYKQSTRSQEQRNVDTLKAMTQKEKDELKKSLTLLTRTPLGI